MSADERVSIIVPIDNEVHIVRSVVDETIMRTGVAHGVRALQRRVTERFRS